MVKFLKFILLVVIIAFAFALGVKFSDSFKGNLGNLKRDEIKVETEMNKAFEEIDSKINKTLGVDEAKSDMAPLTDEEKNAINNSNIAMPEYVDIEIVEPMDGVAPISVNNQVNPDMVKPTPINSATQPNTQLNPQQPTMQPNAQPSVQPNVQPNIQNGQHNGQQITPSITPQVSQAVPNKK